MIQERSKPFGGALRVRRDSHVSVVDAREAAVGVHDREKVHFEFGVSIVLIEIKHHVIGGFFDEKAGFLQLKLVKKSDKWSFVPKMRLDIDVFLVEWRWHIAFCWVGALRGDNGDVRLGGREEQIHFSPVFSFSKLQVNILHTVLRA